MAAEFQTHVDEMVREADLHEVTRLDQRDPQLRHQRRDREDDRRGRLDLRSTFASNPLEPTRRNEHGDLGGGDRGQRTGRWLKSAPPEEPVAAAQPCVPQAPAFVPPNLVLPARPRWRRGAGAAGLHPAGRRAATPRASVSLIADHGRYRGRRSDRRQADAAARASGGAAPPADVVDRRVHRLLHGLVLLLQPDLLLPGRAAGDRAARAGQSRSAPDLHAALRGVLHAHQGGVLRRRVHRVPDHRQPDLAVRRARPVPQREARVAAVPGGDAGAVPARRGAGLLLRVPVRLAVLRQLPGPDRRRRRADRAAAAGVANTSTW